MKLDGSKQRILIVDDMPTNIKILGEMLRTDYEITVATTGPKALKIAEEQPLDLILLDIMMPDMDGYAVCRELKTRSRTKNIPVIFITTKNESDDEVKGLELGAVDYITKPFHLPIVKARVRTHLDLKRKYDILEAMVSLDGLTEIPNRRSFDELLQMEWKRNMRGSKPLTLFMMDIDFFKQYNDHYGHTAGDDCLKLVAQALNGTLQRAGDLVARYGGEEFAALLPETDAISARALAERMRESVEALGIPHSTSLVADHVTISLGVVSMIPTSSTSPVTLIDAADAMLYKAKRSGRNRVESDV